jgi:aerobic-type carbon monoxide dehydrogenase small subunit (CoxS/CutS family)
LRPLARGDRLQSNGNINSGCWKAIARRAPHLDICNLPSHFYNPEACMANVKELRVNGARVKLDADRERPLLSVLREDLGLTGAHYGCGEAQCGACTVLVDGAPVRSCVTPVGAVEPKSILTVEGLEKVGKLHPLQQAFLDVDAMQCAYCTSGMLMAGAALLRRNQTPSREEMLRSMNGNLCRCGVYSRILEAITRAGAAMKEARNE